MAILDDIGRHKVNRAAKFCIRCKLDVSSQVEPNISELQYSILNIAKADTSVAVAVLVRFLRIDAKRHSSSSMSKQHWRHVHS